MGRPGVRFGQGLTLFLALGLSRVLAANSSPTLENDTLRVSLDPTTASLTVLDKRIHLTWQQHARAGYQVAQEELKVTPTSISAKVLGEGKTYLITISLDKASPQGMNLQVDLPGQHYVAEPGYPFVFKAPASGWYYVQNTSGEGMLMPLSNSGAIMKEFSWSGSQPWWGLTDLNRGMAARLNTFRNPQGQHTREDHTVYAIPMQLNYTFLAQGGYNALANEYRRFYLNSHPELKPLAVRAQERPALNNLKDGVYVYLWGKNPEEDLNLVKEMK